LNRQDNAYEKRRPKAGFFSESYLVFIMNATMTPTAATMAPVTQGEPWLAQVASSRGASASTWK
jgi:hypothetical protein